MGFLDFVSFFIFARFLLHNLGRKDPTPCQEQKTRYSNCMKDYGSAERLAKLYFLKRHTFFLCVWRSNIISFVLLFLLWYKFVSI